MQTVIIPNSNVIEIQGNLFEAPTDMALGHCVSKNFEMSRGIALEFKKKFGQVESLKQQNKNITEISTHQTQLKIYTIYNYKGKLLTKTYTRDTFWIY